MQTAEGAEEGEKKAAGCGKKLETESTWEKCNPPSRRGGQSRKLMTRPEDMNAQKHNGVWRDVSHVDCQFGLVHQFKTNWFHPENKDVQSLWNWQVK